MAKSASSVNLVIGLAREGKKVAMIDTDPQGSTALSLGYKPDELSVTLATIMGKITGPICHKSRPSGRLFSSV